VTAYCSVGIEGEEKEEEEHIQKKSVPICIEKKWLFI
jgi:hypothetical protein